MDKTQEFLSSILQVLTKKFNVDTSGNDVVETGDTIVPYQEIPVEVYPGQRVTVNQVFDYFRVLEIYGGADDVQVAFGQSGRFSKYRAGIGYNCPVFFDRVTLYNDKDYTITVNIAISNGQTNDNRLKVTGQVNTVQIGERSPSLLIFNSYTFTANDYTIINEGPTLSEVIIQNIPDSNMFVYVGLDPNSGFRVYPGQSLVLKACAELVLSAPDAATGDIYVNTIYTKFSA